MLPRHAPVIANLQMGRVDVYENGQISSSYMIDGGLADVTGEKLVILAQRAEDLSKVTAAELRARAKDASEADASFYKAVADEISA